MFRSLSATFVEDDLLLQHAVIDAFTTCRTIVGLFKHSSVAYGHLRSIQEHLRVPQHRLQQDVCIRWKSTLYMVKSVIIQKMSWLLTLQKQGELHYHLPNWIKQKR